MCRLLYGYTSYRAYPQVKPRADRKSRNASDKALAEATPLSNSDDNNTDNGADFKVQMSSLEIAEVTGKRHYHVTRDIRKMLDALEKDDSPFLGSHISSQGKPLQHYLLDHDLTMTLVAGYNVKLRHAIIVRLRELEMGEATPWHEQEAGPEPPQLPDFTSPAEAIPAAARP